MIRHSRSLSSVDGFTLLEMLIVLAIIGMSLALTLPALRKPPSKIRLEAVVRAIGEALKTTRVAAVVQRKTMSLAFDLEHREVSSPAVSSFALPADVGLTLKVARLDDVTRVGEFRFFPDGSSTGGTIGLSLGGLRSTICVSWVNGVARIAGGDRGCGLS